MTGHELLHLKLELGVGVQGVATVAVGLILWIVRLGAVGIPRQVVGRLVAAGLDRRLQIGTESVGRCPDPVIGLEPFHPLHRQPGVRRVALFHLQPGLAQFLVVTSR